MCFVVGSPFVQFRERNLKTSLSAEPRICVLGGQLSPGSEKGILCGTRLLLGSISVRGRATGLDPRFPAGICVKVVCEGCAVFLSVSSHQIPSWFVQLRGFWGEDRQWKAWRCGYGSEFKKEAGTKDTQTSVQADYSAPSLPLSIQPS